MSQPFDEWADTLPVWERCESKADAEFYVRVVSQLGAPVVELGIGYGRVAALVRPDVGVDSSATLLERCARLLPDIQLICADLADYVLPQPAAVSYAPLNTLTHVVDEEHRARSLANILRNTRPGGHFVFDAFVPDHAKLDLRNGSWRLRARSHDAVISVAMIRTAENLVEVHGLRETTTPDGTVTSRRYLPPLPAACLTPMAIYGEVTAAGWRVQDVWGDFAGKPYADGDQTQIWHLVRPPGP